MPIKCETPDAIRLSLVCYLRTKIFKEEQKYNKTQKKRHGIFLNTLTRKNKSKS
jgi:hypothetical protein